MAGETVMLWDRGLLGTHGATVLRRRRSGRANSSSSWQARRWREAVVLVRLKPDREARRGNRSNWLLIKHHDGIREGRRRRRAAMGRTAR